jgi:hypothetical protein
VANSYEIQTRLRKTDVEIRRKEIAESIRQANEDFEAGRLQPQSAQDVLTELHRTLEITE